jgi:hypothetical protein
MEGAGLVCTGDTSGFVKGWDPRQPESGPSSAPAFSVESRGLNFNFLAGPRHGIGSMARATSGGLDRGPQLLTGMLKARPSMHF